MKLDADGLVKRYGDSPALDSLTLHVSDARVLALIGPSGGGKSTLLRILGGLESPDSGTVAVNARPLPTMSDDLLAYRRHNGFLFQQFNLFPHLTALENIALPLEKAHGIERARARATASAALERFGLADHARKLPAQLSGGQQQRVGIARAVAHQPEILFLDEPTSALDPEMTTEVLELVQELAQAGQHIVLSTHEMGFARAVADVIAFVDQGRIAECAPASRLFTHPQSAACTRFLSRVMRW
jgi:polar amino acid transport system ATP-binding protein